MRRRALELQTLRGLLLSGLVSGAALATVMTAWELAQRVPAAVAEPPPEDLRRRGLEFPVTDAPRTMTDSFDDPRGVGRQHHAVDIMAPRGSPVRAVDAGTILKLVSGGAGGTTIYQLDGTERYCYYYAHLQGYSAGLREGQSVARGEVIGYVGTTGNAPASVPHLHFAISRLDEGKECGNGTPVNPYPLLR
jgi:peptidoglycan LD-endopeptidase LytH